MAKQNKTRVDILVVAHSAELSGGAEVALLSMLEYMYEKGVRIHLVSPYKGEFSAELQRRAPHVAVTYLGQPWWVLGKADPHDFVLTNTDHANNVTGSLVKLINKIQPRLCVTNTIALPWLAYAAAITNTPHAWFVHELGLDFKTYIPRNKLFESIDILSDKVFCNSRHTANYFQQFFIHNTDIGVVYPCSEPKLPDHSILSPFDIEANRFIMVGAIIERKGQFDAIQALKQLKNEGIKTQLVIIGTPLDHAYYAMLQKYCHDHGLERDVKFLGMKENPASYIQYADAMLMCSEAEAFGLVTIEAMRLGKPVIGAADAGTLEIIIDNENGLLYRLRDVKDLARKIKLLINDGSLSQKLSQMALNVDVRFSPENCYQEFMDYLQNLPDQKLAINLSPLSSIFDDYDLVVRDLKQQLEVKNQRISDILSSKSWRFAMIVRKLLFR